MKSEKKSYSTRWPGDLTHGTVYINYRNYRIIMALVVKDFANSNSLLAERSLGACTIVRDPLSKEVRKIKKD